MLSVEQAQELLKAEVSRLEPGDINLADAYGNVLVEDIHSPVDLPLFDASSVDGYALACNRVEDHTIYQVKEEIKAGDYSDVYLNPGECARIFTGAMVPASAAMVVMQEYVDVQDGTISLREDFRAGNFIRKKGSQIKSGELALQKGSFLNPGSIGFLASMGISKVKIYRKPEISIIVTGNEIIPPGNALGKGEIYESNSFSLMAALQQQLLKVREFVMVKDDKNELKIQVEKSLKECDILLITGGVSVGKYDFVKDVLSDIGARTVFYKVAQRPGKPLLFAKLGNKLIFGLPGNPASVLNCFYEYVYPAIRIARGFENISLQMIHLKLQKEIKNEGDRASFIRSKITEEGVMPLDKQDSGMMLSFAGGNALIYVPADKKFVARDEIVEVHLLPFDSY
jgi:molybdopterin molybdotransferase